MPGPTHPLPRAQTTSRGGPGAPMQGAPMQGAGPGLSHLQASSKTSSLLTQKPMALLNPNCYNEVLP